MICLLAVMVYLIGYYIFADMEASITVAMLLTVMSASVATVMYSATHHGFFHKALWLISVVAVVVMMPMILRMSLGYMAVMPEQLAQIWLFVTVLAVPFGIICGAWRILVDREAT